MTSQIPVQKRASHIDTCYWDPVIFILPTARRDRGPQMHVSTCLSPGKPKMHLRSAPPAPSWHVNPLADATADGSCAYIVPASCLVSGDHQRLVHDAVGVPVQGAKPPHLDPYIASGRSPISGCRHLGTLQRGRVSFPAERVLSSSTPYRYSSRSIVVFPLDISTVSPQISHDHDTSGLFRQPAHSWSLSSSTAHWSYQLFDLDRSSCLPLP